MLAIPIPNRLERPEPWIDAAGLSGIILSGGNDLAHLPGAKNAAPERDATELALIRLSAGRGLPLLGVCRGLQMLVHAYGGTLKRAAGHVARDHSLNALASGTLPVADRPRVNSFHEFVIEPEGMPAELLPAATAPDGTVEAVAHRTHPQWGIMWHPERAPFDPADHDIMRTLFLRQAP
jgi:putative glutamine amidotransferase